MAQNNKKSTSKKVLSVKEMIKMKSQELSDEDFFLSKQYENYMSEKVKRIMVDNMLPVAEYTLLYSSDPNLSAYTDNKRIVVNAASTLVVGSRPEKHAYVCGMTFHEIGHILFTNFTAYRAYLSTLLSGNLYPRKPSVAKYKQNRLDTVLDFISDENNCVMLKPICHNLINILEDGRIENLLYSYCGKYRILLNGLMSLREHLYETASDVDTLLKKVDMKELKDFEFLSQILLHYIRFGEIKGYRSQDHSQLPLIQTFDRFRVYADDCLESMSQNKFYNNFNLLLLEMWPEITDYIEEIKKEQEQKQDEGEDSLNRNSASSSISEAIEKSLSNLQGTTSKPSESAEGKGTDSTMMKNMLKNSSNESNSNEGYDVDKEKDEDGDTEKKAPTYTKTDSIWGERCGTRKYIDSFIESSNTKVDVKKLTKMIATERADDELEKQMIKDLREFSKKINYGEIHSGMSSCIVRHEITRAAIQEYNDISGPIKTIAKNMMKKSDFYSKDESPVLVKNKYCGTKFNPASIARADFKTFSKKYNFEPAPQLAVAVLIDESGSMSGVRSQAAKAMALTIYEYCRMMEIPISIYGHSTGYSTSGHVQLFAYADFERIDDNDRYRLMNISSRCSNRDGYALRFMMEKLDAQSADKKLLIIVSDGCPADTGYSGTAAFADLADIVKQCERKCIGFVAAAIGTDKREIQTIYGKRHFLNIQDLTILPVTLTSMIKRLLK